MGAVVLKPDFSEIALAIAFGLARRLTATEETAPRSDDERDCDYYTRIGTRQLR